MSRSNKSRQSMTYTTLDELRFLQDIGKHRLSKPTLHTQIKYHKRYKAKILAGYKLAVSRRERWGAIDKFEILTYLAKETEDK